MQRVSSDQTLSGLALMDKVSRKLNRLIPDRHLVAAALADWVGIARLVLILILILQVSAFFGSRKRERT